MKTSAICNELRSLQRHRTIALKSRIMQANRLQAVVAGSLGYTSGMDEKERMKKMKEASALIKAVSKDEADCELKSIILASLLGINALEDEQHRLEKPMVKLAKMLPVTAWVNEPDQDGFGILNLAVVVGEAGDLSDYPNPGKLWKRFGCAPREFGGKTLMGATWKSGRQGKLPTEEWEAFGYSPRRRSIAYNVGEPLLKLNHGPYRARYDEARAKVQAAHPDYAKMRCHRHGMLLMTKLLLKNLWIEWHRCEGTLKAAPPFRKVG